MSIIALAFSGLKLIDEFFSSASMVKSVSHLSDAQLKDIGFYRDGDHIVNLHLDIVDKTVISPPTSNNKLKKGSLLSACYSDSGG